MLMRVNSKCAHQERPTRAGARGTAQRSRDVPGSPRQMVPLGAARREVPKSRRRREKIPHERRLFNV
jgi:hypothetical protein